MKCREKSVYSHSFVLRICECTLFLAFIIYAHALYRWSFIYDCVLHELRWVRVWMELFISVYPLSLLKQILFFFFAVLLSRALFYFLLNEGFAVWGCNKTGKKLFFLLCSECVVPFIMNKSYGHCRELFKVYIFTIAIESFEKVCIVFFSRF